MPHYSHRKGSNAVQESFECRQQGVSHQVVKPVPNQVNNKVVKTVDDVGAFEKKRIN
jgi:hypothetical protein